VVDDFKPVLPPYPGDLPSYAPSISLGEYPYLFLVKGADGQTTAYYYKTKDEYDMYKTLMLVDPTNQITVDIVL
jgi:hypothetical protein